MQFHDDTPEPGSFPVPYPRNSPVNLLYSHSSRHPKNFFAFEGIDGAGKSTIIKAASSACSDISLISTVLKLSGSEIIRHALERAKWVNADPMTFNLLNWVGVFEQMCSLRVSEAPRSHIFFFDRYTTTIRVRGIQEGLHTEFMDIFDSMVPEPRVTFFVDTDPGLCLERIRRRGRPMTYFERGAREVSRVGEPMREHNPRSRVIEDEDRVSLVSRLERMRDLYHTVLETRRNVKIINNSCDVDDAVEIVMREIGVCLAGTDH